MRIILALAIFTLILAIAQAFKARIIQDDDDFNTEEAFVVVNEEENRDPSSTTETNTSDTTTTNAPRKLSERAIHHNIRVCIRRCQRAGGIRRKCVPRCIKKWRG